MQKIIIKDFGPIKDVDIPIHDFMIFIGPQASGKSTIARVIDFLKESPTFFDWYVRNLDRALFLREKEDARIKFIQELTEEFRKRFMEIFDDLYNKSSSSIKIYYSIEKDLAVTFDCPHARVTFSKSLHDVFVNFFETNYSTNESDKNDLILFTRNIRDSSAKLLKEQFGHETINTFIPAGRSLFSVLSDSFLLDKKISNLYYYRQFAQVLNQLRRQYDNDDNFMRLESNLSGMNHHNRFFLARFIILNILDGHYARTDKRDVLRLANDVDISLENASSGQQESLWILLLLLETIGKKQNTFFVIEEPEAHLYPETQKRIAELIALCVNDKGNEAVITTHSPYILSALNNLLYANEVGKKYPEKVEKVVDWHLWLDYDRVMAYFVDEGKVKSIMDDEMKMIKNEWIDSASRSINESFDKLSDIKYSE